MSRGGASGVTVTMYGKMSCKGNNTGSATNILFGQIPAGQFVSPRTYSESLTLTVNF